LVLANTGSKESPVSCKAMCALKEQAPGLKYSFMGAGSGSGHQSGMQADLGTSQRLGDGAVELGFLGVLLKISVV
jgi:hypothetical protein